MRTYFLIFILQISFQSVKSQNCFPTFKDQPKWNYLESGWGYFGTLNYHYSNEITFCKHKYNTLVDENNDVVGYIRVDSNKVYFLDIDDCQAKERMRYDFSLKVGETANWNDTKIRLMRIDTMNFAGINREVFNINFYDNQPPYQFLGSTDWVKGLGRLENPFYFSGSESSFTLLCLDSAGTQLYKNPYWNTCDTTNVGIEENNTNKFAFSISPNPFSSNTIIQTNSVLHNSTLIVENIFGQTVKQINNISGQEITLLREDLPAGLYLLRLMEKDQIIANRKVVITD